MSFSGLVYAGLEEAVNRYLAMDPQARDQMAGLHGKVIAFEILGTGMTLYLVPGPGRLQVLEVHEGDPDCRLRGTPLALAQMNDRKASSDKLFSGEVEISGDTQLAHQFGKILGAMDIDWEEQLSLYTGDIIAHEAGRFIRQASHWGRRTLDTLGLDVKEYLQEELRTLPVREEIDGFLSGVDTLRDDVERLQVRVARLQQKRHSARGEPR
jgi:ubiquinone biosynthesis protein UbiJ